jgi:hypothetical protein
MEFFLDKRLVKKQRSLISVGGHPLLDNWVYPKKLHPNLRLPPCVGGPIPTAYAREDAGSASKVKPGPAFKVKLPCVGGLIPTTYAGEDAGSASKVKMVDDAADVEESDEVKKERNDMQECLILSFVDRTGTAKQTSNYTTRRSRAG